MSSSFTENVDSGWIVVVENLFDANLRIVSASNIFSQRGRDPRRGDEDTIVSSSFILHIGTNPEYLSAIVSSHMRHSFLTHVAGRYSLGGRCPQQAVSFGTALYGGKN